MLPSSSSFSLPVRREQDGPRFHSRRFLLVGTTAIVLLLLFVLSHTDTLQPSQQRTTTSTSPQQQRRSLGVFDFLYINEPIFPFNWLFQNGPWFPSLQCTIRLVLTGFNGGAFDRFPQFFTDESVVTLAQTGNYQGPSGIEEYIQFTVAEYSPYILEDTWYDEWPQFVEYDNTDGQCVFLYFSRITFRMDPSTTAAASADDSFDVVGMGKMYFDFHQRKVSRMNGHYAPGFVQYFFNDLLGSSINTVNYICSILNGVCASQLTDQDNSDCPARLSALPPTEGDMYVDGNTVGCRSLHAVLAEGNPALHCAHVSLDRVADPNDKFKCHDASPLIDPSTLFEPTDFDQFRAFCERFGIDPEVGYKANP